MSNLPKLFNRSEDIFFIIFFAFRIPDLPYFIKLEQYVRDLCKQIAVFHCMIIKVVCVLHVIADIFLYVEPLLLNTPAPALCIRKFTIIPLVYRKIGQPLESKHFGFSCVSSISSASNVRL